MSYAIEEKSDRIDKLGKFRFRPVKLVNSVYGGELL